MGIDGDWVFGMGNGDIFTYKSVFFPIPTIFNFLHKFNYFLLNFEVN